MLSRSDTVVGVVVPGATVIEEIACSQCPWKAIHRADTLIEAHAFLVRRRNQHIVEAHGHEEVDARGQGNATPSIGSTASTD